MYTIFHEARHLVENGWCKFAGARDENNEVVPTTSGRARSFCAFGAFSVAADRLKLPSIVALSAIEAVQQVNNIPNLIRWNDDFDRTKQDVLNAIDKTVHYLQWQGSKTKKQRLNINV